MMSADRRPALSADQVHVWSIDLDAAPFPEAEYLRTLNPAERERAGRFRQEQVRRQFAVGRSWLRRLLGTELHLAPENVPIVAGEYGKPRLAAGSGETVHFNVAHSRSTILIALTLAAPVGIDLEYLDRETDVLEVARHSLTPRETSTLLAIEDPQKQSRAFFECWTRKEAIIKADGRGLSLPLTSFEVPVGTACHAMPISVPYAAADSPTRYFLSDLALGPYMACAVALAGRPAEIVVSTLSLSPR